MDESDIPQGWKIVDSTPSGCHRMLPDGYTPPPDIVRANLPFNRTPTTQFIVRAWMWGWLVFCAAAVGYGLWIWL